MSPVRIPRPARAGLVIALTPLADMFLILVVFFMLTSTYLELNMIPMAEPAGTPVQTTASTNDRGATAGRAILIRLNAMGQAFLAGTRLEGQALSAAVARRLAGERQVPVLILPSPRASIQALVDILGAVSAAGAERVQVVRFDRAEEPLQ